MRKEEAVNLKDLFEMELSDKTFERYVETMECAKFFDDNQTEYD